MLPASQPASLQLTGIARCRAVRTGKRIEQRTEEQNDADVESCVCAFAASMPARETGRKEGRRSLAFSHLFPLLASPPVAVWKLEEAAASSIAQASKAIQGGGEGEGKRLRNNSPLLPSLTLPLSQPTHDRK